ncbi:MAG: signal peptidase I [Nitriliruptorales bacterium]|nr:signal peptidase I [Nitriliruptorales bacterium]
MAVKSRAATWRLRSRRALTVASRLLMAAVVVGWSMFLHPSKLGGQAEYVIVSGRSMEPVLRTGDLAIVRRQASYATGQVVAYRIPEADVGGGMLVIHRIIGGTTADGLLLQGDNRDHPDMWRPRGDDVVGTLRWHIPHAGTVLVLLRSPLVVAVAAGLTAFWLVAMRGKAAGGRGPADSEPAPWVPIRPPSAMVPGFFSCHR